MLLEKRAEKSGLHHREEEPGCPELIKINPAATSAAGSATAQHAPSKMREEAEPESMFCLISAHGVTATGLLVRCQKKLQLLRAIEGNEELCWAGCWF